MNCSCLAWVTHSSKRTRVKLAEMKDMAKTTQVETGASTEEAILGAGADELLRTELCIPFMGPSSTELVTGRESGSSHFGMSVAGSLAGRSCTRLM